MSVSLRAGVLGHGMSCVGLASRRCLARAEVDRAKEAFSLSHDKWEQAVAAGDNAARAICSAESDAAWQRLADAVNKFRALR